MVELLIKVYVVLNFCQLTGFTSLVEIASRFQIFFSQCCKPLPLHICISIFRPLPLISLKKKKRNDSRVGGFSPPL